MPVSLPGWGSGVSEEADAVLVRIVPAGVDGATATVRVKTALPTARLGFEQETVPPEPTGGVAHDQPPGEESETNAVPAGRASLRTTLDAGLGPALITVIEYVRLLPGITGSGVSTLVTERSAEAASWSSFRIVPWPWPLPVTMAP